MGKELEDIVINSNIHPTSLTKNDAFLRKCYGDRLMIPFLGLHMAKSIYEGVDYIRANAYKFSYPLYIFHGKKDIVTDHYESILFFNKCASLDKTLKLFPDGYHEL